MSSFFERPDFLLTGSNPIELQVAPDRGQLLAAAGEVLGELGIDGTNRVEVLPTAEKDVQLAVFRFDRIDAARAFLYELGRLQDLQHTAA